MLPCSLLFAYFGPETVLPVTSVIATVLGIVMMFGKNSLRFVFRWRTSRQPEGRSDAAGQKPHFWRRNEARTPRT